MKKSTFQTLTFLNLLGLSAQPLLQAASPVGMFEVLTKLIGGQGTINAPSWSPDSRNVAFVSYRPPKP